MDDFLRYLTDWETSVKEQSKDPEEIRKMQLSTETIEGLKMTGNLWFPTCC